MNFLFEVKEQQKHYIFIKRTKHNTDSSKCAINVIIFAILL